jgi:hypothetical protein
MMIFPILILIECCKTEKYNTLWLTMKGDFFQYDSSPSQSWAFDNLRAAFFRVPPPSPPSPTSTASPGGMAAPQRMSTVLRVGSPDYNLKVIHSLPTQGSQLYPFLKYITAGDVQFSIRDSSRNSCFFLIISRRRQRSVWVTDLWP